MVKSVARRSRGLCLFSCQGRPFAVTLDAVAEVVELDRLVRVPLCPSQIVGFCALRRDIIPVVRLVNDDPVNLDGLEVGSGFVALFLQVDQGVWAIRIDREGVVVLDDGRVHRLESAEQGETACLVGTVDRAGTTYNVIDPEATWRNLRNEIENWYGQVLGHGGHPEPPRP